jgi:hypothetical protein
VVVLLESLATVEMQQRLRANQAMPGQDQQAVTKEEVVSWEKAPNCRQQMIHQDRPRGLGKTCPLTF